MTMTVAGAVEEKLFKTHVVLFMAYPVTALLGVGLVEQAVSLSGYCGHHRQYVSASVCHPARLEFWSVCRQCKLSNSFSELFLEY